MVLQWDREGEQHVTADRMEEKDQGKSCVSWHI